MQYKANLAHYLQIRNNRKSLKKVNKRKKFIIALVGVVAIITNELTGKTFDQDAMVQVVALLATFIFGQGLADYGKAAAHINNESWKEEAKYYSQAMTTTETE